MARRSFLIGLSRRCFIESLTADISISVDSDIKEKAQEVLADLGLDMHWFESMEEFKEYM